MLLLRMQWSKERVLYLTSVLSIVHKIVDPGDYTTYFIIPYGTFKSPIILAKFYPTNRPTNHPSTE